jgi:hypothetical protein
MASKFREHGVGALHAHDLPRAERKERIKKYGHLNLAEKSSS